MPWEKTDVVQRLWAKTTIQGECCIWTGAMTGRGYGQIWYEGKMIRVHRMSAHIYLGFDLDSELNVNHKPICTNNACWNPEHIYVGTQAENVADQIEMGRFVDGRNNLNGGINFNKENWMKSKNAKHE